MSSKPFSTDDSSSSSDDDNEDEEVLGANEDISPQLLTTRYRLWLHAVNLPRQGGIRGRLPTSYAVVTSQQAGEVYTGASLGAGGTLGQTETIAHTNHPQWTESFVLEYEAGTKLFFFVHVFVKQSRASLNSHKEKEMLLGSARFEVGDILSTHQHTRARRLRSGGCVFCRLEPPKMHLRGSIKSTGQQQIDAAEPLEPVAYLRFRLAAKNLRLPNRKRRSFKHLFNDKEPDTFVTIAKKPVKESRHMWATVFRSQPVGNSLSPTWDLSLVDMDAIGGGRTQDPLNQFIRISVFAVGKPPRLLGFCETTLRIFLQASLYNSNHKDNNTNHSPPDIPSDRTVEEAGEASEFILQRSHRKMKEVGKIVVLEANIVTMDESSGAFQKIVVEEQQEQDDDIPIISIDLANIPVLKPPQHKPHQPAQPEHQESIRTLLMDDGCKINFCVAIDFTSSNGDPRNDQSSLHYQSESLNDYEESILAVGHAVHSYSENNQYSVWGFGAKFDRNESTAHHIFQCGPTPVATGVDGILDAYKNMFQSAFIMSGPTVFLNVLQAGAVQAKRQHDQMTRADPKYTVLLIITDGIMSDFDETLRKMRVYQQVPLSVIFVGVGRSDFADLNRLCRACPENSTFVEFRKQQTPKAFAHAALSQVPRQVSNYMATRFGR